MASVVATEQVLAVEFESGAFQASFQRLPDFGRALSRALAARLADASRQIPLRDHDEGLPEPAVVGLLPVELLPTRTTSGSSRRAARSARAKLVVCAPTSRW